MDQRYGSRKIPTPKKLLTLSLGRKGYWLDNANCRKFFCEFAAKEEFDPLVADNWKIVTYRDLVEAGVRVCKHAVLFLLLN
jgi:hypothetical protein